MKDNMKKIYLFLLAAAGIFAAASCAVEEMTAPVEENGTGEVTTLTFAFDATKTALVNGKTTWAAGDKIRVYNSTGTFNQDVEVPEEGIGQAEFTAEVNMADTLYYAVYPVNAVKSFSAGKIKVNLKTDPDGLFSSANICVAQSKDGKFQMRNATGVLKVKVNSGNVVEILQINAKNPMVGDYEIGFGADTLNFTTSGTSKSVTVAVGGVDGEYFIPVIPGTLESGLQMTALKGNGGFQTLTSTKDNEVKINDLIDMGVIGDKLSAGLNGEGSETNPYVINNEAEFTAFSSAVNLGNPFSGKYIKLATDLAKVETPVGYYVSADVQFPFEGKFLGNNHKVTLALDGTTDKCYTSNYVAFFGLLGEGSSVQDLKIDGTVTTTGNYVGALAGYTRGTAADKITVTNVESTAAVTGGVSVGGLFGHAYFTDIDKCVNKGTVTGTADNGVFFYMTYNSSNKLVYGNAGSDIKGTGGIAGATQNVLLTESENQGAVTGLNKVGGLVGTLFWSTIDNSKNTGAVKGTAAETLVGGIVGYSHCSQNLTNTVNEGTVNGESIVGGICGYAMGTSYGHSSAQKFFITKCHNKGAVTATQGVVGGICGVQLACQNPSVAIVTDCVNDGDVSAPTGYKAAGISAVMADCTGWGQPEINRCINNGKVTAMIWVGGMVAYCAGAKDYWKASYNQNVGLATYYWKIFNCVNNGTILGCRTDKDGGEVAGGMVGFTFSTGGANGNNLGLFIYNCINNGAVQYKVNSHKGVYCGGIVGRYLRGRIYNVVNTGKIGPETGDPVDGTEARLGAIIGSYEDNAARYLALQEAYYLDSSCDRDMGTASTKTKNTANILNVLSFDNSGVINGQVSYDNKNYTNIVEALNAWVNKNGAWNATAGTGYYLWAAGPKFAE